MRFFEAGAVMKTYVGVAIFFWLLCGAVGAWLFDSLDREHWKMIAKGPITLVDAFNRSPPQTYPSGV